MKLQEKAFINLQKNLDIQHCKTGKKDWFHSGYRLLDYWEVKEAVEEFEEYMNDNSNSHTKDEVFNKIKEIFGDFTEKIED